MRALVRHIRRALPLGPFLFPLPAFAHAFGQQYTLPLPVSFYAAGASVALVASFIILSFFSHPSGSLRQYERVFALPEWLRSRAWAFGAKIFGVAVLLIAILTGFLGSQDVTKNPALFLFWIGLLLILAYASAVVSGLWRRVDPFRTLAELVLGRDYPALIPEPPAWAKYAPAILFYYFVLWFELLSYGAGAVPQNVASLLVGYVIITFFGVVLFGNDAWFRWGDFFSVLFGVLGRFAPFALEEGSVRATPPGERLLAEQPESPGLLVFILLILSSTAYDGLHETQPWVNFFAGNSFLTDHTAGASFLFLIAAPFIFLAFYALAIFLMQLIVRFRSYGALLSRFAYSLVPIAVAYNIAHYFTLVISEGQNFIPMLSDPLGRGMDIFGTATYVYNPGLIGAKEVWYVQVIVIVVGHIIATYIAHRISLREFSKRSHVIMGQLPMLALMVLYTCFGLWVLSLPFAA